MKKNKYIIGTGWWCDGSGGHAGTRQPHILQSSQTHEKEFFQKWYFFVNKYTKPEKIIVVDSNSPVPPALPNDPRIEFIKLFKNFGHPADVTKRGEVCGWERGALMGAWYSYVNDADFVYIEQDCLVIGESWYEECLASFKNGKIMYGSGLNTPQPMQQCLVIIKKEFIPEFANRLSTEAKKMAEAVGREGYDAEQFSPERRWYRAFNEVADMIPFGYGRVRPLNAKDSFLYAQHWTDEELKEIAEREKNSLITFP